MLYYWLYFQRLLWSPKFPPCNFKIISDISVSEYKSVKNTLKKRFNKYFMREFKHKSNILTGKIQRNINNAYNLFWKSFYLYVAKDFHWLTIKSNKNLYLVHGWQKALLNDPKKEHSLYKKHLNRSTVVCETT